MLYCFTMDQVAVLFAGGEEKIRDQRDQNLWEVIEVIEYIQNSPGFCQEGRFCLRHDKSLFPRIYFFIETWGEYLLFPTCLICNSQLPPSKSQKKSKDIEYIYIYIFISPEIMTYNKALWQDNGRLVTHSPGRDFIQSLTTPEACIMMLAVLSAWTWICITAKFKRESTRTMYCGGSELKYILSCLFVLICIDLFPFFFNMERWPCL